MFDDDQSDLGNAMLRLLGVLLLLFIAGSVGAILRLVYLWVAS